jgi:hypothetical protein
MDIHWRQRIGLRTWPFKRMGTAGSRNTDYLIDPGIIGLEILIGKRPISQLQSPGIPKTGSHLKIAGM